MSIELVINGFAQAQRSPQGVIVPPLPATIRNRHSVRFYSPVEVRKWQTTARVLAAERMKNLNPVKGAIELIVWVYLVPPSSMSKRKQALALDGKLRPVTRPDVDNYAKAILDSLNGIVWIDDSQIVALHVYKYYADKPRVVIKVEEFADPLAALATFREAAKQSGLFK